MTELFVPPVQAGARIMVRPYPRRSLAAAGERSYDLLLATLGYEERARAVSEVLQQTPARAACGFHSHREHAYEENRVWYEANGFEVTEVGDKEYAPWLAGWAEAEVERSTAQRPLRLAVDISSMTRDRIAAAVELIVRIGIGQPLEVDFLYAPAEFHSAPGEPDSTASIEPVTEFFRGAARDPKFPVMGIAGLGYEPDKAVGAKEYLEIRELWAFVSTGGDKRWRPEIEKANTLLSDELPEDRLVEYPIDDPYATFLSLESHMHALRQAGRPVVLPMGPKIFALCSMIAALHHYPDVSVWRVRQRETARPRKADGTLYGLTLEVEPSEPDVEAL